MDLASMLKRESFFEIFFPTVERYFKEVYREDVHLYFASSGEKKANLFIYPRLSAAVVRNISKNARSFFYSEWNVRGSWIKRLSAKLYVWVMTHSLGLLAQYRFHLEPAKTLSKNIVIAPNNRSIRVFDYKSGLVGCIIKQGFTNKYFINQLKFRLEHKYYFVPPLTDYGDSWFREPIMYGHPLARVTDEVQYKQSIVEATANIAIIAKDTLEYQSCDEYVKAVSTTLHKGVAEASEKKHIESADALETIINRLVGSLKDCTFQIPVVLSHGDLQTGNIWVDIKGKTWVYDWETVGYRSVWYDAATLLLSLRREGGIERIWQSTDYRKISEKVLANDNRKNYSDTELSQIVSVVVLEDIAFHLEDMLELPQDFGSNIFNNYTKKLIALMN